MAERVDAPARPLRLRRRVGAVALLVALVGGSGLLLERVAGPRAPGAGAAPGPVSGSWFCPHGGSPGWQGWVAVTNPGPVAVQIRLTRLGPGGPGSVSSFSLGPRRQVYRPVDAADPADATVVEYFGGWVGASAVLRSRQSPAGAAAEGCEPAARPTWYLLDEPTGQGESSYAVVMNPFDEDAEFDVTVRTEQRTLNPGPLTPYVLPAHRSVGLHLNGIALAGEGEQTVTVQIEPRLGRVVAGSLSISGTGIRIDTGVPAARDRTVSPGAGDAGPREVLILNPNDTRADVSVISQGPVSQKLVSSPDDLSVPGGGVRTVQVDAPGDSGTVVESSNGRPVVTAVRLFGAGGDSALIPGTADLSDRWLVMPTVPPSGGRSFVVLENPGRTAVQASVVLIGGHGPVPDEAISSVVVPAGRTLRVALSDSAGNQPLSAVITADGTLVAAGASYSAGGSAYAATLALPMKE